MALASIFSMKNLLNLSFSTFILFVRNINLSDINFFIFDSDNNEPCLDRNYSLDNRRTWSRVESFSVCGRKVSFGQGVGKSKVN